jgi:hypothetical protein
LLRELAPDEEKFYAEGAAETKEKIEKMKTHLSTSAKQPDTKVHSAR